MKWLVHWWSDPGERVLDPFCGLGTIASACQQLGRRSVNIDINPSYVLQARARCQADLPVTYRRNGFDPDAFELELSP